MINMVNMVNMVKMVNITKVLNMVEKGNMVNLVKKMLTFFFTHSVTLPRKSLKSCLGEKPIFLLQ
jgi:hypothetical protein